MSYSSAVADKFNLAPDPIFPDLKKLLNTAILTHIAGLLFFHHEKLKNDKVKLRTKANELVDLATKHSVAIDGLPKALHTTLMKAVNMQR